MSSRRLVVLAAVAAFVAAAAPAQADTTSRGLAYLARAQNADGGLGNAPGQRSNPLTTQWAAIGVAAAGRAPSALHRSGGRSLGAAVARQAAAARETGDVERAILALTASHRSVPATLVSRLLAQRRSDGSFDGQATWTAFGVLALRAAGRSSADGSVRAATRFLARQQNGDGGFNFLRRGARSGIDDTAAAIQGLIAGGTARGARSVRRAVRFVLAQQGRDGGFPLQPHGASNAQSTAWAVQALTAAGRNPDSARRSGSRTPLAYLRSLQATDGSIRYSRTSAQSPVWVTAQVLTALARRALPVR